jgi:trk system potassium uptake protein TrkH
VKRYKGLIKPILGSAMAVTPFFVDLAPPYGLLKGAILDGAALFLLISEFLIFKRVIRELRRRPGRWPFAQLTMSAMSLGLLLLWFSRWIYAFNPETGFKNPGRYLTFLQASSLLLIALLFMRARTARLWRTWAEATPARSAISLFFVAAMIGTYLLIMPWSLNPDASVKFIDALFISISALTVTGLSPLSIEHTFSTFGKSILLILIQLGGLGIITLSVGLAAITRRRMSLSGLQMGQEIYGIPNLGATIPFISKAALLTLSIEVIGALLLLTTLPQDRGGFFNALFHSVSAFCNAGFSTYNDNLIFQNGGGGAIAIIGALIMLGSIGFPVLFEIGGRLVPQGRRQRQRLHFSGYVRLTLLVALVVYALGFIAIFTLETIYEGTQLPLLTRLSHAAFYTISSRTAGFNIHDLATMSLGGQLFIALLMIIGGSPVSTAGGIKTTTTGVLVIATTSILAGHKWIQFRYREIPSLILQKAVAVITIYFTILFLALLVLFASEQSSPWPLAFEAISALSTTGLSIGATANLTPIGKMTIMALMVTGRVGLLTMIYAGVGKQGSQRFRYPKEQLYVG